MEHTPGPWALAREIVEVKDKSGEVHKFFCADVIPPLNGAYWRGAICTIQSADHLEKGVGKKEAEANARLIAAAPDLLEALEDAEQAIIELCAKLNAADVATVPDDYTQMVCAAIAKARVEF